MADDVTPPVDDAEVAAPAEEVAPEVPAEEPDGDLINALAEGVSGEVTENEDPFAVDDKDESAVEGSAGEEGDDAAGDESAGGENASDDGAGVENVPEPAEAEAPPVVNPGDFQPSDYSFEITTTDGKTVKIATLEDADAFANRLDENPELISASQFMQFNRKVAGMDVGIASEKKAFDQNQEAFEAQQAVDTARQESINQWDKEVNYLAERGELPPITPAQNAADWTDPKVAAQPGIKERVELLHWMDTENDRRITAGLEPMRSMLDAHNAMSLEAMRKGEVEADDKDAQARRARGAFVPPSSSPEPFEQKKSGTIVGLGGTLDDFASEMRDT